MVAFAMDAIGSVSAVTEFDFSAPDLWGKTPRWGLRDDGVEDTQSSYYWYYWGQSGNESVITNYAAGFTPYNRFAAELNPQPSYMRSGANNRGYLEAWSDAPLVRTFAAVERDGASPQIPVPSANDLFVDTLVRFEPRLATASEVPSVDVAGCAKFMCWLSAPEGATETNLIVTAGRYLANGQIERANYVVTNEVVAGRWYRLTARAIKNASTGSETAAFCFALYLDGQQVACEPAAYVLGEDTAAIRARFAGNALYEACALFPSILADDPNPGLRGFAVQGRAAYDELGVVNSGNPFDAPTHVLPVSVVMAPEKVTNVICQVTASGAAEPYFMTNVANVASVSFTAQPGDVICVEALVAEGNALAPQLAASGNMRAVNFVNEYNVFLTSAATFESGESLILRVETGSANFRVGDRVYESLEEAIWDAIDLGEPLELGKNVTLGRETENGQMYIYADDDLVFDLCGHTLTGEHFQDEATIYDKGRLTVYDSVGGGAIVAPGGTAIEVVSVNDAVEVDHAYAALTLGDEKKTGLFTVSGRVRRTEGALTIKGGRYLTPFDLEPTNAFYLASFVEPERFAIEGPVTNYVVGSESTATCTYWTVVYDGRLAVRFEAERGTVTPTYTNVTEHSQLFEPTVLAPGYSVTNWSVVGTGARWDFATDVVTSNLTLRAQLGLDSYTISYHPTMPSTATPHNYTVESPWQKLAEPTKEHFTFGGWSNRTSVAERAHLVDSIGQDAVFVGTDIPVTGDLDLQALWTPDPLVWKNTGRANSESNGTYSGSWPFVIPVTSGVAAGDPVVVESIDFCIVNPHLYPKTAPCLAVTPKGGAAVVSAERVDPYEVMSEAYPVAVERLSNGRPKIGYRFSNLIVKAGETNSVRFCATDGTTPQVGFLRLLNNPENADAVFGNCTENGGDPSSGLYLQYCPVYEVHGYLWGGDE